MIPTGEPAKAIFERAGLPNEVLGRIWALSDREGKGALDMTEFIIAMHLVTSFKARALTALPSVLPPGLYEAAARRGAPPPPGNRISAPPPSAIPRQLTGSQRAQSPLARASYASPPPPMAVQTTGGWLISPQEKAKYDQFFNGIDTAGAGTLNGEQAVRFFSDSGLPEDTLAQIWDLADINSEGSLNRDEFAVAMYLIRQERSKPAGGPPLPAFLPPALIPPTMRNQPRPAAHPTAPTFDNAANTSQLPKSAAEDLFGLDASPQKSTVAAPAPLQSVQNTGSSVAFAPVGGTTSPTPSSPTVRTFSPQPSAPSTMFKPFMPSSAFGASLAAQTTGSSSMSAQPQQRAVASPSHMDDLLGEAPEEETKNITNDTSELANMSNQIGNLRNQMQDVQTKKDTQQRDLTATNNQKRDLEVRLQQFRASYEQEVRAVKALEEQLTASRNDTKRMQQDLAMIEGTHQDLSTQHQTVAQQLVADQQENAALKQRISQLNAEIAQLKPQVEKLRSAARQQKGMVAINKKQLATNEGEHANTQGEISTLTAEAAEWERSQKAAQEEKERQHEERGRALQDREGQLSQREMQLQQREAEHTRTLQEREIQLQQRQEEHLRTIQEREMQLRQREEEHSRSVQEHSRAVDEHNNVVATQPRSTVVSPAPRSTVISPAPSASTNPFFRSGGTPGPASPGFRSSSPGGPNAFDAVFGPSFSTEAAPTTASRATESGQSISSEGRPTPSATPPLSATQDHDYPPAPPESRQFTPNNLPLRRLQREPSFDSSVRGLAPPSIDGRSVATTGPIGSAFDESEVFDSSQYDDGVTTPPTQMSGPALQALHAEEQSREPVQLPTPLPETDNMPGAFPEESATPMTAQTSGTREIAHQTAAASHDDFDSAFADFGNPVESKGKESTSNTFEPETGVVRAATGHDEFPAIRELEHDDTESDSDNGFDDDFSAGPSAGNGAPLEPEATEHIEHAAPAIGTTDAATSTSYAEPTSEVTARDVSDLPKITAQSSPPTYETVVESPTGPNSFPPEFTGLLPSREDPTQARQIVSTQETSPFTSTTSTTVPVTNTEAFDDDFAGFDDLDEAQEATGDESAFGIDSELRESVSEFNPTFDSPTSQSVNTSYIGGYTSPEHTPVVSRMQNSAFSGGFDSSSPTVAAGGGSGGHQQQPSLSTAFGTTTAPQPQAPHDWDAIFSGLDNPSSGVDTSFPSVGETTTTTSTGNVWAAGESRSLAPPTASGSGGGSAAAAAKAEKPVLGRAMTTTGEHDDPTVKRLVGMGFERAKAVKALEDYDYNIDRVSFLGVMCFPLSVILLS